MPTPRGYGEPKTDFGDASYPAVAATQSRLAQVGDGVGALFTEQQIRAARDRVSQFVPETDRATVLEMLGLGDEIDPALLRQVELVGPYNG